ncbi:MAG: universal stress protein [Bacteroidota bacterium]
MKTILIPTDFSETAKNAADYAIEFAKHINALVVLLHVFHIPIATTEAPVIIPSYDDLEKDNLFNLKEFEQELRGKHGLIAPIECIVKPGFIIDEIRETIKEKNIDLVVMGITGVNKLAELLIGSNTIGVIKGVKCPTLIIPKNAKFKPIKTIAFACDFEEVKDESALKKMKTFVKELGARLLILNVVDPVEEKVTTEKAVSGVRLVNMFDDINHSLHFPEDDDPVHAINEFIELHNVDLLVMVPHKHNIFSRIFREGTTKKMAFHTHIPLLAIHD